VTSAKFTTAGEYAAGRQQQEIPWPRRWDTAVPCP